MAEFIISSHSPIMYCSFIINMWLAVAQYVITDTQPAMADCYSVGFKDGMSTQVHKNGNMHIITLSSRYRQVFTDAQTTYLFVCSHQYI